jgi:glycosyltransferase involved in cell wall biosynthesis
MVSIIIPSYKDPFLPKTVDSVLENAQGEIEVLVVLDGYIPETPLRSDPRVRIIKFKKNRGMRGAINAGIKAAKGEYILKSDSHCLFGPGFDKIMAENCRQNWLMVPRRYSLDEIKWVRDKKRPIRDYHYLAYPDKSNQGATWLVNVDWDDRTKQRNIPKYLIDDTMTFQGSCWLANKKYFMKRVGYLDDSPKAYGPFGGEQLEIGSKYWLGGGKVKVIKKTWYAHLLKRQRHYQAGLFTRDYKIYSNVARNRSWSAKHWLNNLEPGMIHPFSWLVEKFWPVPSWPEDRSLWVLPE